MDLVSDFTRLIDKNTGATIDFLKSKYVIVNEDKNYNFIKDINKYYTGVSIWVKKITESNNSEQIMLLNNILMDYCSILNSVILGDEKIFYFLVRNIIESFIRAITMNFTTRDLEQLFKDIAIGEENEYCKQKIQTHVSRLKQIYNDSCLYIHADTSKIPMSLTNLIKYYNYGEEKNFEEARVTFKKINLAMLNIFQLLYRDTYIDFKDNAKSYLNELIELEDRITFYKIISK